MHVHGDRRPRGRHMTARHVLGHWSLGTLLSWPRERASAPALGAREQSPASVRKASTSSAPVCCHLSSSVSQCSSCACFCSVSSNCSRSNRMRHSQDQNFVESKAFADSVRLARGLPDHLRADAGVRAQAKTAARQIGATWKVEVSTSAVSPRLGRA